MRVLNAVDEPAECKSPGIGVAATGVGALIESAGAAAASADGLASISAGLGIVSTAADLPDCISDPSLQGCTGAVVGFASAALGGAGRLFVEEGTIWRGLTDITSLGLGIAGLTWDAGYASKACGQEK